MHDNLVKTFGEEILKLSEILSEEKQIREQQHNNMLRILEDLNDSLATSLKVGPKFIACRILANPALSLSLSITLP